MPNSNGVILGFDPGGQGDRRGPGNLGNFGWSICTEGNGELRCKKTGLGKDAQDVISKVKADIPDNATVLAAGIDAPLFWDRTGTNRKADDILKRALSEEPCLPEEPCPTVIPINSLHGACVVQGPLLVRHISDTDWQPLITESHPKALRYLLRKHGLSEVSMLDRLTKGLDSHELDATLAAVSAWAAIYRNQPGSGWQNLYDKECRPCRPFEIPISYWMPIP